MPPPAVATSSRLDHDHDDLPPTSVACVASLRRRYAPLHPNGHTTFNWDCGACCGYVGSLDGVLLSLPARLPRGRARPRTPSPLRRPRALGCSTRSGVVAQAARRAPRPRCA